MGAVGGARAPLARGRGRASAQADKGLGGVRPPRARAHLPRSLPALAPTARRAPALRRRGGGVGRAPHSRSLPTPRPARDGGGRRAALGLLPQLQRPRPLQEAGRSLHPRSRRETVPLRRRSLARNPPPPPREPRSGRSPQATRRVAVIPKATGQSAGRPSQAAAG